ncbi:MAG: PIN domain-containing protein [Balneolaceae bacterium]|nr:PIN domain-containing protein [Balneolaceae bacterium]
MEIRALLDVNICLDAMLDRQPFSDSALRILQSVERQIITGVVPAISFDTIFYLLRPAMGTDAAHSRVRELSRHVRIGAVTEATVRKAIDAGWKDLEDAIQYHTALQSECDVLVTRNVADFKGREIPILTPEEFLSHYLPDNR